MLCSPRVKLIRLSQKDIEKHTTVGQMKNDHLIEEESLDSDCSGQECDTNILEPLVETSGNTKDNFKKRKKKSDNGERRKRRRQSLVQDSDSVSEPETLSPFRNNTPPLLPDYPVPVSSSDKYNESSKIHEINIIDIGTKFNSFDQLTSAIHDYEEKNFTDIYIRSSRSIEAGKRRAPKRIFAERLKYSEIDLACRRGGRKIVSHTQGIRPKRSSCLLDCPFKVLLRASQDGEALVVTSSIPEHNHIKHKAKQGRLNETDKADVAQMFGEKDDEEMLQSHVKQTCHEASLPKDMKRKSKSSSIKCLEQLVNEMRKYRGTVVEICVDDEKTLKAVFFQTKEMKDTFSAYPELLLVDATYKMKDPRISLYVMMVEDGNGESEIVAFCFTVNEDQSTIQEIMEIFKSHNTEHSRVEVIMTDKDMIERCAFKSMLPQAVLQICSFYTLKSMKREINAKKLGITEAERISALDILQKMVCACNEAIYDQLHEQLENSAPRSVLDYFNNNWHSIRSKWVSGLKFSSSHLNNRSNNRLESASTKIQSIVTRCSSMKKFFYDLMKCVETLSIERDHQVVVARMKTSVLNVDDSSPEAQFQKALTPFASKVMQKELKLMNQCQFMQQMDNETFKFCSSTSLIIASPWKCSCDFRIALKLPCRHILSVRKLLKLPLFCERICSERWTMDYFMRVHGVSCTTSSVQTPTDNVVHLPSAVSTTKRILSEQQKYSIAFDVIKSLAEELSECGMAEFSQKLDVLKSIRNIWNNGEEVVVSSTQSVMQAAR